MHIAILVADSNGCYPVPASKDGAVSTLIESLVKMNSIKGRVDLTVVSYYDRKAEELSKKYKNVNFIWIKTSCITRFLDSIAFKAIKLVFRKKKAISFKSIFSLLSYIRQTSRILKKHKFDKVVLENNIPLAWTIKLSKYQGDYYYHFHNIPRIDARCRDVFDNCTGFLCVSKFVGICIASKNSAIGSIPENKIRVLYNCIKTDKFKKSDCSDISSIKEKYGILNDEKVVIFVGRLSAEKGILELLNAIQYVKYDRFKVLIVGSYLHNIDEKDEYQQKLYNAAKAVEDKVIFTGYINQKELPLLYNISDVAVLPSIWEEPAGLTMIEASACGVPVVTTNSGGIPEYVGDSAVILEKNENLVKNISLNIDRILSSDNIDMKNKSAERIRDNFDIKKYLDNFVDALSE